MILSKGVQVVKTVPMGETGIPQMNQQMDPLHIQLLGLLLEPLHQCGLHVFI